MNNFDLNKEANDLVAKHSPYQLARLYIQTNEAHAALLADYIGEEVRTKYSDAVYTHFPDGNQSMSGVYQVMKEYVE